MKSTFLLAVILLLISVSKTFAQQNLFAGRVNNFSTQYDVYPYGWSAFQILGNANVYPAYGDIDDAFNPEDFGVQRDFIDLGFDNFGPIDSIFIYETFTPGFIDSVFVRNPGTMGWELVYSATPSFYGDSARILAIGFPTTTFNVNEIRLTIANDISPDWVEIDAVAISPASTNTFTPSTSPGMAYSFDGTDDVFHSYSHLMNLFQVDNATMAAWVNIQQPAAPTVAAVYEGAGVMCDASGTYMGIYLANAGGSDSLYFYNYDGADQFIGMDYTLNTWMHIAWVHTEGYLRVYKNGVLYREMLSGNTDFIGIHPLEVGHNLFSDAYFQGMVDEVITFNRGLDDTEIWNVMHMNIPGNMNGMTGYWQMDDCINSNHYNPVNHIADSLYGLTCVPSGVPNFSGIENISNAAISIYPNPAADVVNISLQKVQAVEMLLYNVSGQLISTYSGYYSNLTTLPVINLSPGMYTLHIRDINNKIYVKKLIKQ